MLLRTWTLSAFASRNASVELSCLPFPFLLRLTQPPLQHCLGIGGHLQKRYARTHIVLRVDDLGLGLEERFPRCNFHQHQCPVREGIHHVQVASVPAEFAHTRSDAHVGLRFNQLGACNKRVPRRTAFLLICDSCLRLGNPANIIRRFRQPASNHP